MTKGIKGFQKGHQINIGRWANGRSEEVKRKISLGNTKPNAKKEAMHLWVIKHKGSPKKCEDCGRTDKMHYDWSNIDHKYRRVLEDYTRRCRSCHRKFDIKNNGYSITRIEIEYKGKKQSVPQWSKETGIKEKTLYARLSKTTDPEVIFRETRRSKN